MANGKERISISGRQANGDAHQRATRKKLKGKILLKRKEKRERNEAISKGGEGDQHVDINAWTLFVVYVLSLSPCSIASIESQNTGY